jgi:hypothetical protein
VACRKAASTKAGPVAHPQSPALHQQQYKFPQPDDKKPSGRAVVTIIVFTPRVAAFLGP